MHLAVDASAGVALGGEVGEQGLVGALATAHHRGEHLEARAVGELEDPVDDLLRGLAHDLRAALGAVGHPDPGVEQPEVVVDLGDGADGGPGLREADFWSIEMAGESPSMKSTSGLSIWPRNCRAYEERDST